MWLLGHAKTSASSLSVEVDAGSAVSEALDNREKKLRDPAADPVGGEQREFALIGSRTRTEDRWEALERFTD